MQWNGNTKIVLGFWLMFLNAGTRFIIQMLGQMLSELEDIELHMCTRIYEEIEGR